MAKNKGTVYLGYEDEEISAKHAVLLNSNTNKIGGLPVIKLIFHLKTQFIKIIWIFLGLALWWNKNTCLSTLW